MNVYHYHPETGEYVGASEADESPREPGVFLIPAYATETPPPAAQDLLARVFLNGEWSQIVDRRGETWWTEEGAPVFIDGLGDPREAGLCDVEPEPTIEPEPEPEPEPDDAVTDVVRLDEPVDVEVVEIDDVTEAQAAQVVPEADTGTRPRAQHPDEPLLDPEEHFLTDGDPVEKPREQAD